jgi:2-C-methyl-D-erythritol 2,4-cyclodiphosphate synthase
MMLMLRIGHGFDVHKLLSKEEFLHLAPLRQEHQLKLGGINITHDKVLLGHSDADVILHSLCDALLGAAGLGDIGKYFPDNDSQYSGYDSNLFLEEVQDMILKHGYKIENIDLTVLAEKPKLKPYSEQIINNIAQRLNLSSGQVNLKATTCEGLGFIGREEGIAAHAVVLLNHCES